MAQIVVTGATAMCTCGTAPGNITVTSQAACLVDGKPAATIQDAQMVNITPFGLCTTTVNPAVSAATTAALGVLTPQPCKMVPAGTWIPTQPGVLIAGKPCLTSDCTLMCSYMGKISIVSPGQAKTMV